MSKNEWIKCEDRLPAKNPQPPKQVGPVEYMTIQEAMAMLYESYQMAISTVPDNPDPVTIALRYVYVTARRRAELKEEREENAQTKDDWMPLPDAPEVER